MRSIEAPQHPHTDYSVLLRQVRAAGLLNRRPRYYLWHSAIVLLALIGGWAAVVVIGDSWWQLATAAFLAVVFGQLGFLGHDAGHRQITGLRRTDHLLGLLFGNFAIGIGTGWWTDKHNRHHAHPNTEDADPDAMGVLALSSERARSGRGLRRVIFRYQGILFFPMLLLEGWNLHVASVRAIARGTIRRRGFEAVMMFAHAAVYFGTVFLVLPPVKAIVFVFVHQGLFGLYLGMAFAPNHKGMPVLSAADKTDYLRRQVLTARNIRGGLVTDIAFGGLNYQIEHHLFPSMPRPNLRRAQPMVAAYCAGIEVPYLETGVLASYAQSVGHLHAVGQSVRRTEPGR
ncbi:delta fatty acid desaturase [Nocardia mangyaensis]|uniref:Delta fatty acid desaturase n=1 Tax=Nocardia mangyaensis TaxID=2213200 RepID=A0A1J0W380_9NOCA|nr:delta fatty acid desaturase [Nocardia mangyaensis]